MLIISKVSRLAAVRAQLGDDEDQLRRHFGAAFPRVRESHDTHEQSVKLLLEALGTSAGAAAAFAHPPRVEYINSTQVALADDGRDGGGDGGWAAAAGAPASRLDEAVGAASVVIAAGGDGTYLRAAAHIRGPRGPLLVGVNTDPSRSRGKLLAYSRCGRHGFAPFVAALEALGAPPSADSGAGDGDGARPQLYHMTRSRLRVTIASGGAADDDGDGGNESGRRWNWKARRDGDGDGDRTVLAVSALNEVFLGESDPSRPSVHDVSVVGGSSIGSGKSSGIDSDSGGGGGGGELRRKCACRRSSGVLVSTGTGATAWMQSAASAGVPALSQLDVALVLKAASRVQAPPSMVQRVTDLVNRYKAKIAVPALIAANSAKLLYHIREPIVPHGGEAAGGAPTSGTAGRVDVQMHGWRPMLILDGLLSCPVRNNERVSLEIDPENALRTLGNDAHIEMEVE